MKKILLVAGLALFIPFIGSSQFKEKKKPSPTTNSGGNDNQNNSGNSDNSSGNNNSGGSNNSGGNSGGNSSKSTGKSKDKNDNSTSGGVDNSNSTTFSGDYDAPQAFTAHFENGDNIDYTLSNRDPDKIAHFMVMAPCEWDIAFGHGPTNAQVFGSRWIGFDYYMPDIFNAQLVTGFAPFNPDLSGLIFFKKWAKIKNMRIVLKSHQSGNVVTSYVTKEDLPIKQFLGVHVGFGIQKFGKWTQLYDEQIPDGSGGTFDWLYTETYTYTAPQITLGLGYMNISHYSLFTTVKNKTKTKTLVTSMYLDALFYPSATASNISINAEESTIILSGVNYSFPVSTTTTTASLKPGLIQFRYYVEDRWSNRNGNYEWGAIARYGLATNPFGIVYLIFGYGLYFQL